MLDSLNNPPIPHSQFKNQDTALNCIRVLRQIAKALWLASVESFRS